MDRNQSKKYLRGAKARMEAEEAQFAQRLRSGRKHQVSAAIAHVSQMNAWAEQLGDPRRFEMCHESNGDDSDDSDEDQQRAIESSAGERPILAIGAKRAHVLMTAPKRHPVKLSLGPAFDKEYTAIRDRIGKLEQRRRASGGVYGEGGDGVILIDGLRLPRQAPGASSSNAQRDSMGSARSGPGRGNNESKDNQRGAAHSQVPQGGRAGDASRAESKGRPEPLGKQATLKQMRHVLREVATLTQVLREQASVLRSRGWNGASRGDLPVQTQLHWHPPTPAGDSESNAGDRRPQEGGRGQDFVPSGGALHAGPGSGTGAGDSIAVPASHGMRVGGGGGGTPWLGNKGRDKEAPRSMRHFPSAGAGHEGGRPATLGTGAGVTSAMGATAAQPNRPGLHRTSRPPLGVTSAQAASGSGSGSVASSWAEDEGAVVGVGSSLGGVLGDPIVIDRQLAVAAHPELLSAEESEGAGLRSGGEVTAAVGGYRAGGELFSRIQSTLRASARVGDGSARDGLVIEVGDRD